MTNKERQARRRAAAREIARQRNNRRAVAVNMQSVRSGAYKAARQEQDRFLVDASRTWYVVRALPRRATWAAEQIAAIGIPVFEAREAVRLVSDIGKVRTAMIPVLRRLLFVGVRDWRELKKAEEHPGVYDDRTGFGRRGTVDAPGGGRMVISAKELQNFADCITGFGGDIEAARRILFAIGDDVVVEEGAFTGQPGKISRVDERTGRVKVDVPFTGGVVSVDVPAQSVRAA